MRPPERRQKLVSLLLQLCLLNSNIILILIIFKYKIQIDSPNEHCFNDYDLWLTDISALLLQLTRLLLFTFLFIFFNNFFIC